MRGAEAKKVCPDMILVQVPTSHGKADLTIYRDASAQILKVLGARYSASSVIIERASIDEVYLDVTIEASRLLRDYDPATFVQDHIDQVVQAPTLIAGDDSLEVKMSKNDIRNGHAGQGQDRTIAPAAGDEEAMSDHGVEEAIGESVLNRAMATSSNSSSLSWLDRPASQWTMEDRMLLAGTLIIQQLRRDVWDNLGFTCSAGIASNKMLAKLASGMHKPNKQTLVPVASIRTLIDELPFSRVQGFGGKLGQEITQHFGEGVTTMSHLLKLPRDQLLHHFGHETTQWILQRAMGIDNDAVQDRALPISIGCSKSFRSTNILTPAHLADGSILFWLSELAKELMDRIQADVASNQRRPKQLHVGFSVHLYSTESQTKPLSKRADNVQQWWEEAGISLSKTTKLPPLPLVQTSSATTVAAIAQLALSLVTRAINEHPKVQQELLLSQGKKTWGITYMGLSVNVFEKVETGKKSIFSYLKPTTSSSSNAPSGEGKSSVSPRKDAPSSPSIYHADGRRTRDFRSGVQSVQSVDLVDIEDDVVFDGSDKETRMTSVDDSCSRAQSFHVEDNTNSSSADFVNDDMLFGDAAVVFPTALSSTTATKMGLDQETSKRATDIAADDIDLNTQSEAMKVQHNNGAMTDSTRGTTSVSGRQQISTSSSSSHISNPITSQSAAHAVLLSQHAKYLKDVDIDTFLALPPDMQQELLNAAMFRSQQQSTRSQTAGAVTGKKR